MKKLVFIDSTVSGKHVDVGVLRLERYHRKKYDAKAVVIRDPAGNKLLENCIPVPKWAEPHIFNNWTEELKEKIIWPLPKDYIRKLKI